MYSRRGFGRLALVGLPLSLALAKINSKIDGVQLGIQTYSFRDLPLAEAIQAIATDGLGACELYSPHIEGGHTDRAPVEFRSIDNNRIVELPLNRGALFCNSWRDAERNTAFAFRRAGQLTTRWSSSVSAAATLQ